jgi:hypothetical protein
MDLSIKFDTYVQCLAALDIVEPQLTAPFTQFVRDAKADLYRAMRADIRRGHAHEMSPALAKALADEKRVLQ